ncbi:hypothetical protein DSO57_1024142 [Entomophthora muscae]|uniref:Uncharacterized protein n=1 Tax=Entomophthora muscae TaxID=34485 RepID=A0ACC2UD48_9FUNG|nr:hypothetical protein DSO57_1024142 [Entomophthora muscae]
MKSRLSFIKWSLCASLCLSLSINSVINHPIQFTKYIKDISKYEGPEGPIEGSELAVKLALIVLLVLLGGLLAGLTLGLMSLDETNLEILIKSGTSQQKSWALRILPIRKNGHLLLVTMMLANTLTNMSLPVLIDEIFGGGVYAVLISTGLILVFGEIIPQAFCARHGLRIGALFAWPVRVLIWIMFPVAYPFATLLDFLLGENHGFMYRKAELKELVAIHGNDHGGSLSYDEVTIIRGALDLSEKMARQVMTPWSFVFMIDLASNLDWVTMRDIQRAGHSRVPIFEGSRNNCVGLILTKSLLLLNPNMSTPVSDVRIYYIPKVRGDTSLVNLLNIFQEGASHMAQVVDDENKPIGIVTLEDVIEELIQEEIIDETDVYIDVVKRTRATRTAKDSQAILANLVKKDIKDPKIRAKEMLNKLNEVGPRPNIFASPKPGLSHKDSNDDHRPASYFVKSCNQKAPRPGTEDDSQNVSGLHHKISSRNISPDSSASLIAGSF